MAEIPWTREYFQLKWGGGATTRQFHLQLAEANPAGAKNLSSDQRALDGSLLHVEPPWRPRTVDGHIRISASDAAPWGTLAELKAAWAAGDLEAELWGDDGFWKATWLGDWRPVLLSPVGAHLAVEIHLEERSRP